LHLAVSEERRLSEPMPSWIKKNGKKKARGIRGFAAGKRRSREIKGGGDKRES